MKTSTAIDPDDFERLLSRNLKLPLFGGLFGAVVFVGLILFLLNTIGWVELVWVIGIGMRTGEGPDKREGS